MTAALVDTAASPVRLRPAPALEPPYDDERPDATPAATRSPHDVELPLDWGRPTLRPIGGRSIPRVDRPVRPRPARPRRTGWQVMADDLPLAIKQFVDMYVEVLNGRRPVRHLLPYASDEAFRRIRLAITLRGKGWWPVGRRGHSRDLPPAQLRNAAITVVRLRACEPLPGVVEVAAVLARGNQVRAVALRLEREGLRWTCTALEFVG
ncbi:MAG: Rv3235 family protein [Dehalococcoidia bacterium]